ncbi:MAG: hypothetical protein R3F53_22675 [Gammaproteobacteria bacterium]
MNNSFSCITSHNMTIKITSAWSVLKFCSVGSIRRSIILPAEFITLAEETGLIVPIGQWVLQEAFKQLSAWPELDYLCFNIVRANLDPASGA